MSRRHHPYKDHYKYQYPKEQPFNEWRGYGRYHPVRDRNFRPEDRDYFQSQDSSDHHQQDYRYSDRWDSRYRQSRHEHNDRFHYPDDQVLDRNDPDIREYDRYHQDDQVLDRNNPDVRVYDRYHQDDQVLNRNNPDVRVYDRYHQDDQVLDRNNPGIRVYDRYGLNERVFDRQDRDNRAFERHYPDERVFDKYCPDDRVNYRHSPAYDHDFVPRRRAYDKDRDSSQWFRQREVHDYQHRSQSYYDFKERRGRVDDEQELESHYLGFSEFKRQNSGSRWDVKGRDEVIRGEVIRGHKTDRNERLSSIDKIHQCGNSGVKVSDSVQSAVDDKTEGVFFSHKGVLECSECKCPISETNVLDNESKLKVEDCHELSNPLPVNVNIKDQSEQSTVDLSSEAQICSQNGNSNLLAPTQEQDNLLHEHSVPGVITKGQCDSEIIAESKFVVCSESEKKEESEVHKDSHTQTENKVRSSKSEHESKKVSRDHKSSHRHKDKHRKHRKEHSQEQKGKTSSEVQKKDAHKHSSKGVNDSSEKRDKKSNYVTSSKRSSIESGKNERVKKDYYQKTVEVSIVDSTSAGDKHENKSTSEPKVDTSSSKSCDLRKESGDKSDRKNVGQEVYKEGCTDNGNKDSSASVEISKVSANKPTDYSEHNKKDHLHKKDKLHHRKDKHQPTDRKSVHRDKQLPPKSIKIVSNKAKDEDYASREKLDKDGIAKVHIEKTTKLKVSCDTPQIKKLLPDKTKQSSDLKKIEKVSSTEKKHRDHTKRKEASKTQTNSQSKDKSSKQICNKVDNKESSKKVDRIRSVDESKVGKHADSKIDVKESRNKKDNIRSDESKVKKYADSKVDLKESRNKEYRNRSVDESKVGKHADSKIDVKESRNKKDSIRSVDESKVEKYADSEVDIKESRNKEDSNRSVNALKVIEYADSKLDSKESRKNVDSNRSVDKSVLQSNHHSSQSKKHKHHKTESRHSNTVTVLTVDGKCSSVKPAPVEELTSSKCEQYSSTETDKHSDVKSDKQIQSLKNKSNGAVCVKSLQKVGSSWFWRGHKLKYPCLKLKNMSIEEVRSCQRKLKSQSKEHCKSSSLKKVPKFKRIKYMEPSSSESDYNVFGTVSAAKKTVITNQSVACEITPTDPTALTANGLVQETVKINQSVTSAIPQRATAAVTERDLLQDTVNTNQCIAEDTACSTSLFEEPTQVYNFDEEKEVNDSSLCESDLDKAEIITSELCGNESIMNLDQAVVDKGKESHEHSKKDRRDESLKDMMSTSITSKNVSSRLDQVSEPQKDGLSANKPVSQIHASFSDQEDEWSEMKLTGLLDELESVSVIEESLSETEIVTMLGDDTERSAGQVLEFKPSEVEQFEDADTQDPSDIYEASTINYHNSETLDKLNLTIDKSAVKSEQDHRNSEYEANHPTDGILIAAEKNIHTDIVLSDAETQDPFELQDKEPDHKVDSVHEIVKAPVITKFNDSIKITDSDSDSETLPSISLTSRRRRFKCNDSVKTECTQSSKKTSRVFRGIGKHRRNSDPLTSDGEEGDVEDNIAAFSAAEVDEVDEPSNNMKNTPSPKLFSDGNDEDAANGAEEGRVCENIVKSKGVKFEFDDNSTSEVSEPDKQAVKDEPNWLVNGYTQEPDVILLSDDDDYDIIMSFSQPVLKLDIDENIKVKSEQDSDYDLFSQESGSDKGSDFEPDNIFSSLLARKGETLSKDSKSESTTMIGETNEKIDEDVDFGSEEEQSADGTVLFEHEANKQASKLTAQYSPNESSDEDIMPIFVDGRNHSSETDSESDYFMATHEEKIATNRDSRNYEHIKTYSVETEDISPAVEEDIYLQDTQVVADPEINEGKDSVFDFHSEHFPGDEYLKHDHITELYHNSSEVQLGNKDLPKNREVSDKISTADPYEIATQVTKIETKPDDSADSTIDLIDDSDDDLLLESIDEMEKSELKEKESEIVIKYTGKQARVGSRVAEENVFDVMTQKIATGHKRKKLDTVECYDALTQVIDESDVAYASSSGDSDRDAYNTMTQVVERPKEDIPEIIDSDERSSIYNTLTQVNPTEVIDCDDKTESDEDVYQVATQYAGDPYGADTQVDTIAISSDSNDNEQDLYQAETQMVWSDEDFYGTLPGDDVIDNGAKASDSPVNKSGSNKDKVSFDIDKLQHRVNRNCIKVSAVDESKQDASASKIVNKEQIQSTSSPSKGILKRPALSNTAECTLPEPPAKKVRLPSYPVKMIEPQKLKSTAEKRASGLVKTASTDSSSVKQGISVRDKIAGRLPMEPSGNDDLVLSDVSRDQWLSKKSQANTTTRKVKGVQGKGQQKTRTRRSSKGQSADDVLSARVLEARCQLKERAIRGLVRPDDIADTSKKLKPSIPVTNTDVEDVELPSGSQMVRLGLPILNDIGRVMIKKKPPTTLAVPSKSQAKLPGSKSCAEDIQRETTKAIATSITTSASNSGRTLSSHRPAMSSAREHPKVSALATSTTSTMSSVSPPSRSELSVSDTSSPTTSSESAQTVKNALKGVVENVQTKHHAPVNPKRCNVGRPVGTSGQLKPSSTLLPPGKRGNLQNERQREHGEGQKPKKAVSFKPNIEERAPFRQVSKGQPSAKLPARHSGPAHPLAKISMPVSRAAQPPILRPPPEPLPATLVDKPNVPVWEDILKVILKWTPKWFEEADLEQNKGKPPPVTDGWLNQEHPKIFPLCTRYESFEEYSQQFMLPLLLYETWESCHRDWVTIKHVVKHQMIMHNIEAPREYLWTFVMLGLTTKQAKASGRAISRNDVVWLSLRLTNGKEQDQQVMAVVENITYVETPHVIDSVCQQHSELAAKRQRDTIVQRVSLRLKNRKLAPDKSALHQIRVISSLVTSERAVQALRKLPGNPLYKHLLYPTSNDTFINHAKVIPARPNDSFNTSQLQAINTVGRMLHMDVKHPQVCLIQGPPGTGKSHTIIGLIKRLMKDRKGDVRICLCTPSNAAVDELVRRLIKSNKGGGDPIRIVRLGRKSALPLDLQPYSMEMAVKKVWLQDAIPASLRKEKDVLVTKIQKLCQKMTETTDKNQRAKYNADIKKLQKQEEEISKKVTEPSGLAQNTKYCLKTLKQANVIAGTLSSMADYFIRQLYREMTSEGKGQLFHCVIIDEATQGIELDTLIPLQYGTPKLLLVGDPQQLAPTVLSQKCQDNRFNMSLFERLDRHFQDSVGPKAVLLLNTQYRMHPEIAHFPNSYVYEGQIKNDSSLLKRPKHPLVPYLLYNIEGRQHFSQGSKSMSNPEEAIFTAKLCSYIVKNTKQMRQSAIGIIAPYNNQKSDILDQLRQRGLGKIEVSTVDGFQGQEKDVIILSCVRSGTGTDSIGFVGNRNRINVALTRARHAMYILGHLDCLKVNIEWKALIDDATERNLVVSVSEQSWQSALSKCMNT